MFSRTSLAISVVALSYSTTSTFFASATRSGASPKASVCTNCAPLRMSYAEDGSLHAHQISPESRLEARKALNLRENETPQVVFEASQPPTVEVSTAFQTFAMLFSAFLLIFSAVLLRATYNNRRQDISRSAEVVHSATQISKKKKKKKKATTVVNAAKPESKPVQQSIEQPSQSVAQPSEAKPQPSEAKPGEEQTYTISVARWCHIVTPSLPATPPSKMRARKARMLRRAAALSLEAPLEAPNEQVVEEVKVAEVTVEEESEVIHEELKKVEEEQPEEAKEEAEEITRDEEADQQQSECHEKLSLPHTPRVAMQKATEVVSEAAQDHPSTPALGAATLPPCKTPDTQASLGVSEITTPVYTSPYVVPGAAPSMSPSPCRVFTTECSMQELEAVLRKQESRMESHRRSTPAKVAAMNRERKLLHRYSQQAAASSAMHSASLQMIQAVGSLQQGFLARNSSNAEENSLPSQQLQCEVPSEHGGLSVTESWKQWSRSAKLYGFQMWQAQMGSAKESRTGWAKVMAAVKASVKEAVFTKSDEARAAKIRRGLKASRLLKACEMSAQSESGKLLMREAERHWRVGGVLRGLILWMEMAQMRLVQHCLLYSARSHWQVQALLAACNQWQKICHVRKVNMQPGRDDVEELRGKARRLSAQSHRCLEAMKNRRHSLTKVGIREQTPPLLSQSGGSAPPSPIVLVA